MSEKEVFQWTKFYPELANKLLRYKNNRQGLLILLEEVFKKIDMRFPFRIEEERLEDICPFSIFGCFNKHITDEKRIRILSLLAQELDISEEVPTSFEGVPVLDPRNAWFFGDIKKRTEDIPNLWKMFEVAIAYADNPRENTKKDFITYYDKVIQQPYVKWKLSIGLYWIRPEAYLNLDGCNRGFLIKNNKDLMFWQYDLKREL